MPLPWLKNYKHSREVRQCIANAGFGRIPWNKGKKLGPRTEEVKRKLSKIHKGKSYHNKGFQKGHKSFLTPEQYKEIGRKHKESGLKPPLNWKGGVSKQKGYGTILRQNRRARILGNGGSFTKKEWEGIKIKFHWTCPACMRSEPEIKLTIDHIISLFEGGKNIIDNIQPLCGRCNRKKHATTKKYKPVVL